MRRRSRENNNGVRDYRHEEKRSNNPPAGLVTYERKVKEGPPPKRYEYDPHLDPQLVWSGKAEHTSFEVDTVSVHIHERVSTQAIVAAIKREPKEPRLFADPQLSLAEAVEFYQHDVDWANRLILGDSLVVMNSLLERELMGGKVQMIYMDPPYGVSYNSNFQPRIDRRDVKDGEDDSLTREPEQIKAYRDTWELGIHSYLSYLRDRLLLGKELLTESGSIFVQISDENVHLVRCLMDEVFGSENFVCLIFFSKTTAQAARLLPSSGDMLLWYAKNLDTVKYRQLYWEKGTVELASYSLLEDSATRAWRRLSPKEVDRNDLIPQGWRIFSAQNLRSQGFSSTSTCDFEFQGRLFNCGPAHHWKTTPVGLLRVSNAGRLIALGETLNYKRYLEDFPVYPLNDRWQDTAIAGFSGQDKIYVVQTAQRVIERCVLMTTDPGDLVLDPTCVREGTRVLTPAIGLPSPSLERGTRGEELCRGEGGEGLTAIERLRPGDLVLTHEGRFQPVLEVQRREHRGRMVGLRRSGCEEMLWLTSEHPVAAVLPPLPEFQARVGRARELRRRETESERILWEALHNGNVGYKFRRQHVIGGFVADFYCAQVRLAVEVDGGVHVGLEQTEYDRERQELVEGYGIEFVRVTTGQVERDLGGVLNRIGVAVERRQGRVSYDVCWVPAGELKVGDEVLTPAFGIPSPSLERGERGEDWRVGRAERGVGVIEKIGYEESVEPVYNLTVAEDNSYATEVCVVHNCGSGTTAYCADKWGRRWITIDTSRVALALARQRVLTATFPYYRLAHPELDVKGGFVYETVPHVTLKSIAHNREIDEVSGRYQPEIDGALGKLNEAMGKGWKEWEVPRVLTPASGTPSPSLERGKGSEATEAHERFWETKGRKREEIDELIRRNADRETLYDKPEVERGKVRVSGPFTVEAIPAPVVEEPMGSEQRAVSSGQREAGPVDDPGGDHVGRMIDLLRKSGVTFPGGKRMGLENLRPMSSGGILHAEAEVEQNGGKKRVVVSFGPRHGPVTARQVEEAIRPAHQAGYDILIFAGFGFDAPAQEAINKVSLPDLTLHGANVCPDVLVGDLLKTTAGSQLFTVFGEPDVEVKRLRNGTYEVELRGVDIYDPNTGELHTASGRDAAAWFVDTDYDGRTFCICQAFFPGGENPWEKLQRALRGVIDAEKFEAMRGTVSEPFEVGKNRRVAVKVIDFRGNEVVRVVELGEAPPLSPRERGEGYGGGR